MSKISLPYQIANDTPADAGPVQSNYSRIEQHINTELIERGGTVAMTGQLRLVGNPVNSLDAAPKQYVDTLIPVGGVMLFGGVAAPAGGSWLVCDGKPYAAADYPALFAVIDVRFGGSGGFFNVPDLSDRVPMGSSPTRVVGAKGGSADAIVPLHDHDYSHGHGASAGNDTPDHAHAVNDHSHGAPGVTIGQTSTNHVHGYAAPGSSGFLGDGTGGASQSALGGPGYQTVPFTSTPTAPGDIHNHTATVGNTGGIVGGSLATIGANARHSHAIAVNGFAGRTQAVGTAVTNANLPPFVVMAYLIRAA